MNKLVNNFINYKIKNELNTIDIKLSNKIINNALQNIINDDMKILTSIEAVNINKLVYSNETINYLNEKYYIVSYSILKSLKIVKSDFLILENIDNDNINNIIHTISREIDWVNTQKYELKNKEFKNIIFKNTCTGIFFHECIGHFLEADYYNSSPIRLLSDLNILPKNINILENYNSSNYVDDFGNKVTNNISLIENGKIKNILSNTIYSYLFNIENTGNSINEKINIFNIPRMRNMFLQPEENNLVDLISQINDGIIIEEISMGEVDIYSGEFTILIEKSYLIEKGKITRALKEHILNFNIRDLRNSQIKLCNDLKNKSSLCCKSSNIIKVKYCTPSMLLEKSN